MLLWKSWLMFAVWLNNFSKQCVLPKVQLNVLKISWPYGRDQKTVPIASLYIVRISFVSVVWFMKLLKCVTTKMMMVKKLQKMIFEINWTNWYHLWECPKNQSSMSKSGLQNDRIDPFLNQIWDWSILKSLFWKESILSLVRSPWHTSRNNLSESNTGWIVEKFDTSWNKSETAS